MKINKRVVEHLDIFAIATTEMCGSMRTAEAANLLLWIRVLCCCWCRRGPHRVLSCCLLLHVHTLSSQSAVLEVINVYVSKSVWPWIFLGHFLIRWIVIDRNRLRGCFCFCVSLIICVKDIIRAQSHQKFCLRFSGRFGIIFQMALRNLHLICTVC